jgi:hypothetical protein
MDVDPQAYYDAAAKCYQFASEFQKAFDPLYQTLFSHDGMAGDYAAIAAWTTNYDQHTQDFVKAATTFANAAQNLGDVITAAGYNWDVMNHAAAGKVAPTCPTTIPTSPLYGAENPVVMPGSAKGRNSNGLDGTFTKVISKIEAKVGAGQIPDGNTDKLAAVADGWNTFANHSTVTGAQASIQAISAHLDKVTTDDAHNIGDHLTTLHTAAGSLAAASASIGGAVHAHHDALAGMRSDLKTKALLLFGAAVVVAVLVVVVNIFQPETAAADGEIAEADLETDAGILAGIITSMTSGLAAAAASLASIETVATVGALTAIAGLTVVSADSGPSSRAGDLGDADKPGEPTPTDRLKEHLTDRDLDAARRELDGEVVARKPDGTPWDHVHEVKDAQNGLIKRIGQLQRRLGWPGLSDEERPLLEQELSEASRLLDHSEQFVPR